MAKFTTIEYEDECYVKASDVEAWLRKVADNYNDAREGVANVALTTCADRIKGVTCPNKK